MNKNDYHGKGFTVSLPCITSNLPTDTRVKGFVVNTVKNNNNNFNLFRDHFLSSNNNDNKIKKF